MTDYNLLEAIPEEVLYLINRLNSHGFDAWLVGGCVRDMLLGIQPFDYDIATSALPEQVTDLFERSLDKGIKHGTVTVILAGNMYEVTTYRSEGSYSDGRRPDSVSYESEIVPDLARRDFTINSMAWHPDYKLLDPYGGQKDLQARVLRCVGNAKNRLTEDALRQLRAVRFALNYNLSPDAELLQAINQLSNRIDILSVERIQTELTRTGWAAYGSRLLCFSGTGLISRAFARLLEQEADDVALCYLLAGFIQPFWKKEQIWTIYVIACLFAQSRDNKIIPANFKCYEPGAARELNPETDLNSFYNEQIILRLPLEAWHRMSRSLSFAWISSLHSLMVEKTRLSYDLSKRIQAMLIMLRLRLLLLSADRRVDAKMTKPKIEGVYELRLKMILRSASRQTRLDQWQLLDVCRKAWEILRLFIDEDDLGAELSREEEMMLRWHTFPDKYWIDTSHLPVRGNDSVFDKLSNKRRIGLYLDRLLSKQIGMPRALEPAEAVQVLSMWIGNETVNESNMSY